jgi:hypothetical protein
MNDAKTRSGMLTIFTPDLGETVLSMMTFRHLLWVATDRRVLVLADKDGKPLGDLGTFQPVTPTRGLT